MRKELRIQIPNLTQTSEEIYSFISHHRNIQKVVSPNVSSKVIEGHEREVGCKYAWEGKDTVLGFPTKASGIIELTRAEPNQGTSVTIHPSSIQAGPLRFSAEGTGNADITEENNQRTLSLSAALLLDGPLVNTTWVKQGVLLFLRKKAEHVVFSLEKHFRETNY